MTMTSVRVLGCPPHALAPDPQLRVQQQERCPRARSRRRSWEKSSLGDCVEPGLAEGPEGDTVPGLERLTRGRTGLVRLARTEPPRRQAWTIFPLLQDGWVRTERAEGHRFPLLQDGRVRTERAEGHRFQAKAVKQDWCDACSRQVKSQVLKCQNCSYTCHLECESQVQLHCNQPDRNHQRTPAPRIPCSVPPHTQVEVVEEEEEAEVKDLSEEEARRRIQDYNQRASDNGMKLAPDGSYTGFIQVHLRLNRPITVPAVDPHLDRHLDRHLDPHLDQHLDQHLDLHLDQHPAPDEQRLSSEDGGVEQHPAPEDGGVEEKRTSFYLPSDCVKQLHVSSQTTTREVIQGLLKKFMVLDDPRRFALYRQTQRHGQELFQKLPLSERPLLLRLLAGPDSEQLSFVLKENETGDVEWHAFSVPELQNFLVILEKEEKERVRALQHKYQLYRQKLRQALEQHEPQ